MKNDVYKFRYSEEFINGNPDRDLYHCFDGILIERHPNNGNPYWEDTYWSGSDNRWFRSMEEMVSKGTVRLICNLDDVEMVDEYRVKYYEEEDIIYLPIHKGYRGLYYKKKGSEMSKDVVLKGLENKIKELESNIEYELRKIEWLKKDIMDIENGQKELRHVSF